MTRGSALQDFRPPVKLKLAALWATTMFCYIYGDYFGLFVKGVVAEMNSGIMGPLGAASPAVLVGVALMMAVPSLMIFLSLILPPRLDRWLNILLGILYSLIMLVTLPGSALFYAVLGVIEIGLTATIVWQAWAWPRE